MLVGSKRNLLSHLKVPKYDDIMMNISPVCFCSWANKKHISSAFNCLHSKKYCFKANIDEHLCKHRLCLMSGVAALIVLFAGFLRPGYNHFQNEKYVYDYLFISSGLMNLCNTPIKVIDAKSTFFVKKGNRHVLIQKNLVGN